MIERLEKMPGASVHMQSVHGSIAASTPNLHALAPMLGNHNYDNVTVMTATAKNERGVYESMPTQTLLGNQE